jgi:L-seryl-tRNA(Ser) seleniumtransferase
VRLPSCAVSVDGRLAAPLRQQDPAVVGRVHRGHVLLDLLAVDPSHDDLIVVALRRAAELVRRQATDPEPDGA